MAGPSVVPMTSIRGSSAYFDGISAICIRAHSLGFGKVNTVLHLVCGALFRVPLKSHGIIIIPYLYQ